MARVTTCCEFRIFALVYAVSTLLIIHLVDGRTPKVNQNPEFRQPMMQRSALKTAASRVSGKLAVWRSMQESAPFNQQGANQASQMTRVGRRGGPITAGRKFQGSSVQARSTLAAPKEGILHPPRQSSLPVLPKQQRDRNRPLPLPHLRAIASQTVSRADISACLPKVDHELPSYVVVDAKVTCSSGGAATSLKSVPMAVYENNDVVSSTIRQSGMWEADESRRISHALGKASSARASGNATLIDIGANIGYFTVTMAACGHSVVSFEPFKENIALLQMSMCLNKIEDRVELFQHGLGTQDATCNLASFDINHGDAVVLCDQSATQAWKEVHKLKLKILGSFEMRQLDNMLAKSRAAAGPVDVLKIDVEGYELPALEGGLKFLSDSGRAPPTIFSEFSISMMDTAGYNPEKYLQMLLDLGYAICPINGPYRSPFTSKNINHIVNSTRNTPGQHIWDFVAHRTRAGYAGCDSREARGESRRALAELFHPSSV